MSHRPFCLILLVSALAACSGGASPPAGQGEDLITLLNQQRIQAGCPAVQTNDALTAAAQRHAADMRQHGVSDHTGSDGSTPSQRIAAAGFTGSATGEILYRSTEGGAQEAVTAWMNSPAHRDIISDCRFTHAGVAAMDEDREYVAVTAFGAMR